MTLDLRRRWAAAEPVGLPLLALGLACAVCALAVRLLGASPLLAAEALWAGAFGGPTALGETGLKATALTFTGLAVAVPLAAGFFNIGGQGQFLVGAVAAAWAGRVLALPAPLELPLVLAWAGACGAAYALFPAALKTWRGVHEVISTILLNWIAIHLINDWLVVGPLAAGHTGGAGSGTQPVGASAHLPRLLAGSSRLNLGWPLAVGVALACAFVLHWTAWGLELRALGSSPGSARAIGVPVHRRTLLAFGLGGCCAALGGAAMVLGGGTDFRYPENYRDSYGFDGIAVALLGGGHPLGVVLSATLLGGLRSGAVLLQDPAIGLHRAWPDIAQALAVLCVAGKPALQRLWRWPLARDPARGGR